MLKRNTSKNQKRADGQQAEALAEAYLIKQGYRPVTRNFHSRVGEVDLIMQKNTTYVFVEVRYRANASRGKAAESITQHKYMRCLKTAQFWLMKHHLSDSQFQIDVIAIDGGLYEENITWLPAV